MAFSQQQKLLYRENIFLLYSICFYELLPLGWEIIDFKALEQVVTIVTEKRESQN